MEEKEIAFSFKARYYKLGQLTPKTKAVWFVLHGYGQLAQYFIQKFKVLKDYGICVIAPEGLSRFYLEQLDGAGRKNNRVGATWMTRENRTADIENYLEFLNCVYAKEIDDHLVPITVLGFSQGSATASRWVLDGKIKFDQLILWAGIFPPDMDFQNGSKILEKKTINLVYGTNDPFITDERFAEMNMLSEKLKIDVNAVTFNGAHDIDAPTLTSLIKN